MKIAISLVAIQKIVGGDISRVTTLAQMVEERGLDQLTASEHAIMSENIEAYPYGRYRLPIEEPWYDPFLLLATVAAATKTVGLGSNIIISPLRPAIVLAKEIATLDQLSRGRVQLGLGVGWQKEEYDAAGVPWKGRFGYLMEQIEVCRKLWTEAPTSFSGRTVKFEQLYSLPFPVQGGKIPIVLGLAPTELNIERIALHGDGWSPIEGDPEKLIEPIGQIHARLRAVGRDPRDFTIRVQVNPQVSDGRIDWDEVQDRARRLREVGVTMILVPVGLYCDGFDELGEMLDGLKSVKETLLADAPAG